MEKVKDVFQSLQLIDSKEKDHSLISPRDKDDHKIDLSLRLKNETTVLTVSNWRNALMDKIQRIISDYSLTTSNDKALHLEEEEKLLISQISEKVDVIIKKHTTI